MYYRDVICQKNWVEFHVTHLALKNIITAGCDPAFFLMYMGLQAKSISFFTACIHPIIGYPPRTTTDIYCSLPLYYVAKKALLRRSIEAKMCDRQGRFPVILADNRCSSVDLCTQLRLGKSS